MKYPAAMEQMNGFRKRISEIREEMRKLQAEVEPQPVSDYQFRTLQGRVSLSELFGEHKDLLLVHNMGRSCPGCTLWADGYNGLHPHVTSRAAFAVSSPDPPEVQQTLATSRGWVFRMVSHLGSSFATDMGYGTSERWRPGLSVFRREGDCILRVSDVAWSPGDDFCTVWHFFDLLPEGAAGWRPKLNYS